MYYISLDITVTIWKMWTYIGQEMGLDYFFLLREKRKVLFILGELYCFSIATRINHHWLNCLNHNKPVTSDLYQQESRYLSAGLCCFLNYYGAGCVSAHVCSWQLVLMSSCSCWLIFWRLLSLAFIGLRLSLFIFKATGGKRVSLNIPQSPPLPYSYIFWSLFFCHTLLLLRTSVLYGVRPSELGGLDTPPHVKVFISIAFA